MTVGLPPLTLDLPPEMVDAIAERVAELLAARTEASVSPWLSSDQAADYIAAPLSRVRKLTMTGELPHHKDGRRVLYRRDELDEFIRNGGAQTP